MLKIGALVRSRVRACMGGYEGKTAICKPLSGSQQN